MVLHKYFVTTIQKLIVLVIPKLVLNKRHNDIFYHIVKEAQAVGVLCVGWIPGELNLEYLFTRTTTTGNTRHNLVESIFLNTASPIGGIDKAQVHFHIGVSKYLPYHKSTCGKWVLGLYILFKLIINGYQYYGTREV